MTVLLTIRRLHLYCGTFLLPWVVMFGLSSVLLNHPTWLPGVGEGGAAQLQWSTIAERRYDLDVADNADLRAVGARIIADIGIAAETGYGVGRPNPRRINVNLPSFRHPIRISYFMDEHRVLAERRAFAWGPAMTNMHTRDGYYLRSGWQTAWAVTVDVLCATLVFWVASGLYMWWQLPKSRTWGWLAIAAGVGSFSALMFTL